MICELLVADVLTIRMFMGGYVDSLGSAAWMGIFHSISAFNNAGFGLNAGSLIPYVGDAWIVLPIGLAIVFGGLGFPVLDELIARVRLRRQRRKPPRLSTTARITLNGTAVLLIGGFVMFWALERNHAFAGLSSGDAALAAVFQSITTRTAGFQSVDFGEMSPNALMGTDILMFIGGGSGGTAGGLKITTLFVVLAAIVAEIRGEKDTVIGGRRVDHTVIRQALTVGAVAVGVITFVIACLRTFNPQFSADQIHFEVISAFATVGRSTGITADLSGASQILLCVLMFMGRVGPITLVAALATTTPSKHYSYPAGPTLVNPLDKLLPSARPIDLPPVAIIGLGRFGSAMAEELHSHGVDVLGIDVEEKLLHDSDPHLTDSFIADATDPEALKQLGVKDFQQVVIGIGSSLEASNLTASNLVELGVKDIWAKADSDAHARILTRVGVHHVVRPERDTGRRVAHLLSGRFQDYTVFDQGYAMITLRAPKELVNHSLSRHSLWAKHRVQLVAVHSGNQWAPPFADHQLSPDDDVILAGAPADLEKFGRR